MNESVDHLVIGGGAYGLYVAISLAEAFPDRNVVLLEREADLCTQASGRNPARLHHGYLYPLHPKTAMHVRNNVAGFLKEFSDAINYETVAYYGIHTDSKVSPDEYEAFCRAAKLRYQRLEQGTDNLFGSEIVASFRVQELAFSPSKIKTLLRKRANQAGVDIRTSYEVTTIRGTSKGVRVRTSTGNSFIARHVFNCSYAGINDIHKASGLAKMLSTRTQHHLFHIALPKELKDVSATVINGPFPSIIANRSAGTHVLTHVSSDSNLAEKLTSAEVKKLYAAAIADAAHHLPMLREATYCSHVTATKCVMNANTSGGERRSQYSHNYSGVMGYHVILGGKISSIRSAGQYAVDVVAAKPVNSPSKPRKRASLRFHIPA